MAIEKFDTIQCFRGLAALGVVLYHASISTTVFVQVIPAWCDAFLSNGFLGVDFFFVLSGFIILSSHYNDKKSLSALASYCRKRFIRIFPPYWPVSVALMSLYYFFPDASAGPKTGFSLVSSLFLIPDISPPALSVAWTLMHELLFYFIFATFFVSNIVFIFFISVWMLAIAIFPLLDTPTKLPPLVGLLTAPINVEFIAGMGVAYLSKTILGNRHGIFLVSFGVVATVLITRIPITDQTRILFAVPFSSFVLGGVFLESRKFFSAPLWMVRLGDASYSVYLIHKPILSVTSRIVGHVPFLMNCWLSVSIGVASSLGAGMLYHRFIEKPSMLAFRRLFDRYSVRIGMVRCVDVNPHAKAASSER